jgi:hypothetical protein
MLEIQSFAAYTQQRHLCLDCVGENLSISLILINDGSRGYD